MVWSKGPIWDHFLPREKQNGLEPGGQKEVDMDEQLKWASRWQVYTEEAHLMELLVDEEADKERILDAGELEMTLVAD